MFLSQLALNPRDRIAMRHLGSPYQMHRTILSVGFDGVPKGSVGRVLFRADADPTGRTPPVVLVQSARQPDWTGLPAGSTLRAPECKPFAPHFRPGRRLRFRLRANPTKRLTANSTCADGTRVGRWHDTKGKGKRVGLFAEADQLRWLLRRADAGGFRVPGRWERIDGKERPNFRVDAVPEGRARNDKEGYDDGWFLAVRFEGVLEVTDPDRFRETVSAGVGSAKGYGFGLLSVAPA